MEIKEKRGWWLGQRALELEPFTEFSGGGSDYVTHGNTFGDHNVEASNIVPIVMLKPFAPLQSAGTMILVARSQWGWIAEVVPLENDELLLAPPPDATDGMGSITKPRSGFGWMTLGEKSFPSP